MNIQQAQAGDNIGALIRGIKGHQVQRGMLLCATKSQKISNHFDARIYVLTKDEGGRSKPLTSKYIQQLFCTTWNIPCRLDIGKTISKDLLKDIQYSIYGST